jgi:hypothetical protein
VDESGDHYLERIKPEYPLFVHAFCLAAKADYRAQIVPEVAGKVEGCRLKTFPSKIRSGAISTAPTPFGDSQSICS